MDIETNISMPPAGSLKELLNKFFLWALKNR
jgi:hypothetical protein